MKKRLKILMLALAWAAVLLTYCFCQQEEQVDTAISSLPPGMTRLVLGIHHDLKALSKKRPWFRGYGDNYLFPDRMHILYCYIEPRSSPNTVQPQFPPQMSIGVGKLNPHYPPERVFKPIHGDLLDYVDVCRFPSLDSTIGAGFIYASDEDRRIVKELIIKRCAALQVELSRGGQFSEAVVGGKVAKVKDLLVGKPSLANASDGENRTPLFWAVCVGEKEIAEILLANKANPNTKDNNGSTPLHIATCLDRRDMIHLLLAHKADVNAKNIADFTPLDLAEKQRLMEAAKILRAHGGQNRIGPNTPLHGAARDGRLAEVQDLLSKGADVNARNLSESTPLHEAVLFNKEGVVAFLLAHNADINAKDCYGHTPLHNAARTGKKDIVELLLTYKPEVNAISGYPHLGPIPFDRDYLFYYHPGLTPLDIAEKHEHPDIAALLRTHGGKSGKELGDAGAAKAK